MSKNYSDKDWLQKNLSGKNLQGEYFQGKNLAGFSFNKSQLQDADFTKAHIQGADFTEAELNGAKFNNATAGLQRKQAWFLIIISFILTAILVFILEIIGQRIGDRLLYRDTSGIYPETIWDIVWVAAIIFLIFLTLIYTIHKGLETALKWTSGVGILSISLTLLYALTQVVVGSQSLANVARPVSEVVTGGITVAGIGVVAVIVGVVINVAKIVGDNQVKTLVELGILFIVIPVATVMQKASGASYIYLAVFVALVAVFLGKYIATQALNKDEKFSLVLNIGITLAATGGTSFRRADLTNADFTNAVVGNTDFRDAIITCTRWFHIQKIDFSLVGESYLKNPQLRQLVTSGNGENKNFDSLDLRGVNLREANLENASFIDTNFYQSNLQNANLSGAKLVRSQLESTDLSGATLTGACIEDWLVTGTTKINGIKCELVFLKFVNGK